MTNDKQKQSNTRLSAMDTELACTVFDLIKTMKLLLNECAPFLSTTFKFGQWRKNVREEQMWKNGHRKEVLTDGKSLKTIYRMMNS